MILLIHLQVELHFTARRLLTAIGQAKNMLLLLLLFFFFFSSSSSSFFPFGIIRSTFKKSFFIEKIEIKGPRHTVFVGKLPASATVRWFKRIGRDSAYLSCTALLIRLWNCNYLLILFLQACNKLHLVFSFVDELVIISYRLYETILQSVTTVDFTFEIHLTNKYT